MSYLLSLSPCLALLSSRQSEQKRENQVLFLQTAKSLSPIFFPKPSLLNSSSLCLLLLAGLLPLCTRPPPSLCLLPPSLWRLLVPDASQSAVDFSLDASLLPWFSTALYWSVRRPFFPLCCFCCSISDFFSCFLSLRLDEKEELETTPFYTEWMIRWLKARMGLVDWLTFGPNKDYVSTLGHFGFRVNKKGLMIITILSFYWIFNLKFSKFWKKYIYIIRIKLRVLY